MPIPRRALLAAPAMLAIPRARADQPFTGADLLLVALSDLHSAQERAAATLGAIDAALAANRGIPALILINGDVFERGNAIALRSAGAADWSLLAALRRRAPVVLNLGNHETALLDDMAETVRRARALDLIALSNMRDRRTSRPFADASADIPLPGGRRARLAGIATANLATYRQAVRDTLDIPNPAEWARANLPGLLEGADLPIVISHAGVVADQAIMPLLPDGALLLGGHDHLRFAHARGAALCLHTGSWNRFVTLAGVTLGAPPRTALREVAIEPGVAEDSAHAALWRDVLASHAAPEDREVILRLPRALPLPLAARRASQAMAQATGAATGLIGHTSFGAGLPAGDVTRLDWDAFLRFDGPLFRAEADAAAIEAMAPRLNQDGDMPFGRRIGDFAYAHQPPSGPAPLASNGWVRLNARHFLGTEAPRFAEMPGTMLKAIVAAALRATP